MTGPAERKVLARYSIWKVGAWIVLCALVSGSILFQGWSNGWRPESGSRYGAYFYLAEGAAPFVIAVCLALAFTFIVHSGVAIEVREDQLNLNFPFGQRRVPLREHFTVEAENQLVEATTVYRSAFFKAPPIYAQQVAFYRTGKPRLVFRTILLTEPASTIAERIQALKGDRP